MRQPTNITLNVLDLSGLFKQAQTAWIASREQKLASSDGKGLETPSMKRIYSPYDLGYIQTADGKLFVLTNEGTGREVTDTDPYVLALWSEAVSENTLDKDASFHQQLYSVRLTPSQILGTPSHEQELSQFIRTFGARLERNYGLWKDKLAPYFPLTGENA